MDLGDLGPCFPVTLLLVAMVPSQRWLAPLQLVCQVRIPPAGRSQGEKAEDSRRLCVPFLLMCCPEISHMSTHLTSTEPQKCSLNSRRPHDQPKMGPFMLQEGKVGLERKIVSAILTSYVTLGMRSSLCNLQFLHSRARGMQAKPLLKRLAFAKGSAINFSLCLFQGQQEEVSLARKLRSQVSLPEI